GASLRPRERVGAAARPERHENHHDDEDRAPAAAGPLRGDHGRRRRVSGAGRHGNGLLRGRWHGGGRRKRRGSRRPRRLGAFCVRVWGGGSPGLSPWVSAGAAPGGVGGGAPRPPPAPTPFCPPPLAPPRPCPPAGANATGPADTSRGVGAGRVSSPAASRRVR